MTSIETYKKAYNRMIEMNEEKIKNNEGNFISFEEYFERARKRIERQKATHLGSNRFGTSRK